MGRGTVTIRGRRVNLAQKALASGGLSCQNAQGESFAELALRRPAAIVEFPRPPGWTGALAADPGPNLLGEPRPKQARRR
jgi:hypothetical protein